MSETRRDALYIGGGAAIGAVVGPLSLLVIGFGVMIPVSIAVGVSIGVALARRDRP